MEAVLSSAGAEIRTKIIRHGRLAPIRTSRSCWNTGSAAPAGRTSYRSAPRSAHRTRRRRSPARSGGGEGREAHGRAQLTAGWGSATPLLGLPRWGPRRAGARLSGAFTDPAASVSATVSAPESIAVELGCAGREPPAFAPAAPHF